METLRMGCVAREMIESTVIWLPLAEGNASVPAKAGRMQATAKSGSVPGTLHIKGREVFEWAERVLKINTEGDDLLSTHDQLSLLHLILACLAGRSVPSISATAPSLTSSLKRNVSEDKLVACGNFRSADVRIRNKASIGAAAGLLGLMHMLFLRLPSTQWLPLVVDYDIGTILFEEYLMATDPASAPLLGWPDDKQGRDARKAGWMSLRDIAFCLDGSGGRDKPDVCTDASGGADEANQVKGTFASPSWSSSSSQSGHCNNMTGSEAVEHGGGLALLSLKSLVSQTHHFVESLPPPTTRTEEGPEEMVIFDPEHNGLRHGQPALVGLKNRRNTCYINAMLQQLFFIPEFHKWLEESDDVVTAAAEARSPAEPSVTEMDMAVEHGGHKELSDRLQELFRYLRHSKQRFFDPGEFIKACKSISRQPPLLDQAHTQDDTMTFLESLIDALSSVHGTARHGPAPTDLLKVVEKDRRWVDGTSPRVHRSITGREKEYLMLEIEDGIGNLESALRKHFSEELMTGDNRIWNEKTQSKETVWKAPFIEETSLPDVLVVQLKRFKYNMTWDGRMEPHKLNTKVEFGNVLDLSGYVRRQKDEYDACAVENGSHIYDLQGLVVHSGQTVHSGHYYSFINWHKAGQADDGEPDDGVPSDANPHSPPQNHQQDNTRVAGGTPGTAWEKLGLWYKLDDDMVTQVSEDVVKEESFGGTVESKDQYGDIKRHINSRSAYVLFYRKRRQALATFADEKKKRSANDLDYPAHRAAPCFQPQDKDACSSKRQRAGKADKQTRGNTRDASAMQLDSISDTTQARRSGSLKLEHSHTWPHELTHSCCASVERASLSAAQHALAFDQDFMLWIRDLASYAHKLSLSPPKSGSAGRTRAPEEERDERISRTSDSPQMLRAAATEDAAMVYNTQNAKGVLMQVNNTVSPKGSSSSSRSADRDLTNMERAIASGVC